MAFISVNIAVLEQILDLPQTMTIDHAEFDPHEGVINLFVADSESDYEGQLEVTYETDESIPGFRLRTILPVESPEE